RKLQKRFGQRDHKPFKKRLDQKAQQRPDLRGQMAQQLQVNGCGSTIFKKCLSRNIGLGRKRL
ncbi:hypothetical protein, partial [Methanosarcina sp. A14]